MLQEASKKTLPSQQYIMTQEQKIALIEGKIKRAEANIKALAEIAKRLEKR
jgi:hypothetical protein